MKSEKFDDLRPYYDEEIAPAMHRIAESEYFPALASFVYPNKEAHEIRSIIKTYTTIDEFQLQVMKTFNEQVISHSIRHFSYDGLDHLDKKKCYLFVSNHRDIVMDSSLLQYALYLSGFRTTEITFGSNLMTSQLVVDIGKSNKMFKVFRGGSIKDFYTNSLHLSEYIRFVITEKKDSVWIAQRNGRTKNGIDVTDQGIIKMFCMSSPNNRAKALAELNIVPVAISYQWESCDILKARELYQTHFEKYVKKPGEDVNSILTGISQPKGDVHISIGLPLSESDLAQFEGLANNKFNLKVASLIDHQIYKRYRLTCNNYIAHDIRSLSERYAQNYSEEEKQVFIQRYNEVLSLDVEDRKRLGDIFLGIYANSVDSHLE
jgi:1-acyl-sn-glycerol-3-phosphate acyltransferase